MPPQTHHEKPEVSDEDEEQDIHDVTLSEIDAVGAELKQEVKEGAEELRLEQFTEPSGLGVHSHALPNSAEKGSHDIRAAFSVREEFIRANFKGGIVPNGHEAVHTLLIAKDHFIAAEEDIFEDVEDTCSERWGEIKSVANSAPIAPGRPQQIDSLYS
jgi:hypothetical protein